MKRICRSLLIPMLAITCAVSLATRVYAQPPVHELSHAYFLLKQANNNYEGHKAKAIEHVEAAARALNMRFEEIPNLERERQWKSDRMLAEARSLLYVAREKFEAHDRERAAAHLNRAMEEIDRAIGKEPVRQRYGPPERFNEPYRR